MSRFKIVSLIRNAARCALLLCVAATVTSCGRSNKFDAVAATNWSQTADVQMRQKACAYSFQRPDGSWVCVSTSALEESNLGFVADGSDILPTGYLVYPGGHKASSIEEAIRIASESPTGLHLKP